MAQFRKKLVIEAIQFNGVLSDDILEFFGSKPISIKDGKLVFLTLLDEEAAVPPGNWIIKGTAGGFYSCPPDIFDDTYEPV